MTPAPRASVVVTTYNNPHYLELVLAGYARQTRQDFEVVVADDGSTAATSTLLERLRGAGYPVPLIHAWQPDEGFRKARAVCWAILHSSAPQLIFTDGDCLPPAHMVDAHLRAARPNTLVVGGHIRLTAAQSRELDVAAVGRGAHEALIGRRDRLSMWRWHLKNRWYLAIGAQRRPKIYGLNMSVDRGALYAVNGFDMNYAGSAREDSDLRNRLRLHGARGRCIWHRCIGVHLWHPEHRDRHGWSAGDDYYHRAGLQPRSPHGLQELAAETGRPLPPLGV